MVAIAAAVACATEDPATTATTSSELSESFLPRYAMPMRNPDGTLRARHAPRSPSVESPTPNAPNNKLVYEGGPVISNAKVYAVFWGPNVNATLKAQIPGFYTAVTNSAYFDWLTEYNTPTGTNQHIGRGTYGGAFTITPSLTSTTISQTQIGAELSRQITAGHVPAPEFDAAGHPNSLYMFDFPPGVTITLGSDKSCVQFCAFHYSVSIGGKDIPYGVHPDMGPGSPCSSGCGSDPDFFKNSTDVHSHEMIEAVTDPSATSTAWYSQAEGEIGDICATGAGESGVIVGYTVQKEWSNANGACIITGPNTTPLCDGSLQPPACRPCTAVDCAGAKPVCETTQSNFKYGQCVQCTDNTKCSGATPFCAKTSTATDDTCIAGCTKNSDCSGASPICDTGTHTCRACTGNADCAPNGVCATGASDPKKGTCVQCTGSGQCPAPSVCDTKTDTCVQCTADAQCGNPKPVCGTDESCRACKSDSECASNANGHVCELQGSLAGACVVCSSASQSACVSGTTCDDNTGTCVPNGGGNGGNDAGTGGGGHTDGGGSGAGNDSGSDAFTPGNASGCSVTTTGTSSGAAGIGGLLLALALVARKRRAKP